MSPDSSSTTTFEKKRASWLAPVLLCATLVVMVLVFFAEENWRGKVAWRRVQAQLQAKGEILEWEHYLPEPPPDERNLMKAPGMDEFIKGRATKNPSATWPGMMSFTNELQYGEIHFVSADQAASLPEKAAVFDFEQLRSDADARKKLSRAFWGRTVSTPTGAFLIERNPGAEIARVYIKVANPVSSKVFHDSLATTNVLLEACPMRITEMNSNTFALFAPLDKRLGAAEYLGWSDETHAKFLAMLDEAFKRPDCWLPGDYSIPFLVPIPNFLRIRIAAQLLATRAQAKILLGRADEAFGEIRRIHNLNRIMLSEPVTLVSAMIHVAIMGLEIQTITDGFTTAVWQEKHLRSFIEMFSKTDLLPLVLDSLRSGERAGIIHLVQSVVDGEIPRAIIDDPNDTTVRPIATFFRTMPRGWADQNLVFYTEIMQKNIELFGGQGPIKPDQLQTVADEITGQLERRTPFRFIAQMGVPNLFKARQAVVKNQTLANEAVVASALELYRQKNGTYPDSLQALVSNFLEKIPEDIILGKPLRYHKRKNGEYALYSIAWNAKDDLASLLADTEASMQKILSTKAAENDWVWRGFPEK